MRKQWLIILLVLSACKTAPTRNLPTTPENTPSPTNPAGPVVSLTSPVLPSKEGAITREIPNVAVVLGPGGNKAIAHAGVIKALQENRIPIARIVGVEWGALVAAA